MPAVAAFGGLRKQKMAGAAVASTMINVGMPARYVQNTKCKPDA